MVLPVSGRSPLSGSGQLLPFRRSAQFGEVGIVGGARLTGAARPATVIQTAEVTSRKRPFTAYARLVE